MSPAANSKLRDGVLRGIDIRKGKAATLRIKQGTTGGSSIPNILLYEK